MARRRPRVFIGGGLLALLIVLAIAAPLYTGDPLNTDPFKRLQPPSAEMWLGSDSLGRDVFARTVFGTRVSLLVGLISATTAALSGLLIGLVAGYSVDSIVMRVMDGLMSIPTILLAIALVSLRERPYVDAALCGGARLPKIVWRHILPSTIPPLMVQSANLCAGAILTEAGLSFLGAGVPPEIPSWGNMIASSSLYLAIAPMTVFAPGICLVITVLAVNLLGDGLRDLFDPRSKRRR